MKSLLFLSWRDIKNPKAGGAEIFTHEMLKRMVNAGYKIDHISPQFEGAAARESIDGVNYIRGGNVFSVILFARKHYKTHVDHYDHVVDQSNTHQFFTPLWVEKSKRIFFIHQLTREIWFYHTRFPFSLIGYLMEPLIIRLHRNSPTLTVSQSTKQNLIDYGFKADNIKILPEGLNFNAWPEQSLKAKEDRFTCLYLGRFAKYKGVEDSIRAFAQFHQNNPESQMWLVGKVKADYRKKLDSIIQAHHIENAVRFFGFVSEEKKLELMSRSHCIMVPSKREGWGLIVTEANAVGTVAVVYDSPGLRDSVQNQKTGLVCQENNVDELAKQLQTLKDNKTLYDRLRKNAHEWSKTFHWDNTGQAASEFFAVTN